MAVPHLIKVFGYMYQLNKRNFKAYAIPVRSPKKEAVPENSVHWVGHATTVINLEGKIIVTDPVIGNLGFIKRLVKPSLDFREINVDYVLLTHGHMDHLNYSALNRINKNSVIIAPHGIKAGLKLRGFNNIIVLKSGESYEDAFLKIESIRANHKGSRYMYFGYQGSNSYLVTGQEKSVFFAGDTAHTDAYKGLKADVAIMPVGCYKPDDFLKMHCSPEQSFNMFKSMDCKVMIPVHYKTYILAQDDDRETDEVLAKLNDGSIKIIEIGETVVIE